jgi:MtN3 and saliva related transmembrane protein
MDQFISAIGIGAALLTSLSYVPQVKKAWPKNTTGDLSWKMLAALTTGLVLWIIYGTLKVDWVIALANAVGASLTGAVLVFKARDILSPKHGRSE